MKILKLLPVLFLFGCASLSGISDYVNENPLVADLAARQAAHRYINDNPDRAVDFIEVLDNVDAQLEAGLVVTVDTLILVFEDSINFDRMSIADQELVRSLLIITQQILVQKEIEGELDPEELLGVRSLIRSARDAATLYVR
jgi:hypothetical protein